MKKTAILLLIMTLLLSGCGVFVWNATTEAPKETQNPETTTAVVPTTSAAELSTTTGETTLSPEMLASLEASIAASIAESIAEAARVAASEEASRLAAEASRIAASEEASRAAALEEASRVAAEEASRAAAAAEEAHRLAVEKASYLAYAAFLETNRETFELSSYLGDHAEWFDTDAYRRVAFVDVTGDGFPEMILAVPMDNKNDIYYSPMLSIRIYTAAGSQVKELCKEGGEPILQYFWDQTFAHDMTDTVLYLSGERLLFYRQSGGGEGGEGMYSEEFGVLEYNVGTQTLEWIIPLFHKDTYSRTRGNSSVYLVHETDTTKESFLKLKQEALGQIDQFVMYGLGNDIETAPMGNFDCIYEEGTAFLSMTWDEAIAYLRNR